MPPGVAATGAASVTTTADGELCRLGSAYSQQINNASRLVTSRALVFLE